MCLRSLIPRPSIPPILDCLQYAEVEGEGLRLSISADVMMIELNTPPPPPPPPPPQQLFAGESGPQGFCNDPTKDSQENCTGEFYINIDLGRELISTSQRDTLILVPRVW